MSKRSFGRPTVRVLPPAYSSLLSRGPPAGARRRSRASWLLGGDAYGGPVGSCTPQALAACLNAGDASSVVLMSGKYSPRPSVKPGA